MGDDATDDLNARLKAAAEKKVGGKALTSKFGIDCFALVDALLRSLDGQSAHDFGKVTKDADYQWGDGILIDSLQPGDIIQFRNHVVETSTQRLVKDKWQEFETRTQTRPHHTAIVLEVGRDGSVTVVEQNVRPDPNKVIRNVIPKLEEGEEVRSLGGGVRMKIKVTGTVWFYHPVPKPKKEGSLLRPNKPAAAGGWRALAAVVPSQQGNKRPPGPAGMGAPTGAGNA